MAPTRRWLFRLLALTLVPLFSLGILEAGLRLGKYGYPTSYFLPRQIEGRNVLVENNQFARRFFPRQLVRRPTPLVMETPKPVGTFRIFVLGESAAMGDPEPSFSFSRILEVLLRERFPGVQFEVVNVAFTAINSHVILPIARECAQRQGDLWIVYMGNNEVAGPFGPSTVFGKPAFDLNVIRASLALKTFKIGQLLETLQQRLRPNPNQPAFWTGLQMFTNNTVARSDPRMKSVYAHFRQNLEDILRAGRSAGVPILLSSVASNLKECAPFASAHDRSLDAAQSSAWDAAYREGIRLQAAGELASALRSLQKAAAIDDSYADLQFRLGQCEYAQNNLEAARKCFVLARDLDTLRFRADSELNAIVKTAAAGPENQPVQRVDAEEVLARNTLDGLPGGDFFFDHVHLTYEGNYALAAAFAEETAKLLPKTATQRDTGSWATSESCAERLALTGWDRFQMYELMERRLEEAPFTAQSNAAERRRHFLEKLTELKPMVQSSALEQAAATYRAALELAPRDFHLHENFAKLLNARGDLEGTLAHTKAFAELAPHHPAPYYNLGLLAQAQGRPNDAMRHFHKALECQSDYAEAYNGLGQTLASQGRIGDARDAYSRALALRPNYVEALLNLGETWAKEGRLQSAKEIYLTALRYQSNSFAVRLRVGETLLQTGELFDAAKHLAEAVRLQPGKALAQFTGLIQAKPNDALAHFEMANGQAAAGKGAEALQSLREAIRLKPDFWEARYLLGVELALQNNLTDAQKQFAEVIQLKPDFAPGHLNLGVALAKEMKLAEARAQFEQALRLDPTNQLAAQHLKTLQAIQKGKGVSQ